MELYNIIFQAWKVLEYKCGVMEVMENYFHGAKSLRMYVVGKIKQDEKLKSDHFDKILKTTA